MERQNPGRWWFSGPDQPGARPGAPDSPAAECPPPATTGQPVQPASVDGTALPSISLPKGGGAIRGIDEKLTVDQPSGTARMEIPVAISPGRQGSGPKLAVSYDSGQGNGPYGMGWGVTIPSITRKTSIGLPRYDDAHDSDVFILAGAEDLVPLLDEVDGQWQQQRLTMTVGSVTFAVRRYRPRAEAAFSRIERWEDPATLEVHWRVLTRDNVTSLFGQTASSRIADPADPTRVFSWLLDLSFDDRGNAVSYEYKPEDTVNVASTAHEAGRTTSANRYPKRVWYGNLTPYAAGGELPTDWCFEVVFDYGEHESDAPQPIEAISWPCRVDPFSTYRSGFEVRTFRTCRRILMFHRFPTELGADAVIVRSTDFDYAAPSDPDPQLPQYTLLRTVTQSGWIQGPGAAQPQTAQLPALELGYSELTIDDTLRTADPDSLENVIGDFERGYRRWIDLFGEGLQGILAEDEGAWYYKQNLSLLTPSDQPSAARFGPLQLLAEKPRLTAQDSPLQLTDLNGDGHLCAINFHAPVAGWLELDADGNWEPLRTFATANVDWQDPNLRFVDLDGDGLADLLITEDDVLTWYEWQAGAGFGEVAQVPKPLDEARGPALVFSDGTGSVFLADMSGDGLSDLVRIRPGETSYWPNLGYGRFGAKVVMDGAPTFDNQDMFDARRVRLADIDGSGTADLVYLGPDLTTIWFNQSGNAWTTGRRLLQLPAVDDVAQASMFDLLGTGTASIVWTSPLPDDAAQPLRYIDITGSVKPYLLTSASNNLGATTSLTYAPSTRFYLQDQAADTPWITRLPFPVHVVQRAQTDEAVTRTSIVSSYTYHHGFYDPVEREFRGFARVDQLDAESLPQESGTGTFTGTPETGDDRFDLPPVWTRTWYHTGAFLDRIDIAQRLAEEFYPGDPQAPTLGDTALPTVSDAEQLREACRALRGRVLRQEVYAQDDLPESVHPYTTSEHRYEVDLLQPSGESSYGSFHVWELESIACHYERDPTDPRVGHELTLSVDTYGNATASASVGYPRRAPAFDAQLAIIVTYTQADFINAADQPDFYRLGLPSETRSFELTGVTPTGGLRLFDHDTLRDAANAAEAISYEDPATDTVAQRRLLKRARIIYRKNDLSAALPGGQIESLALVDRSYQLVYSKGLLGQTFVATGKITDADLAVALSGPGAFVDLDSDGNQWAPSARILYSADPQHPDPSFASRHFYLPQGATDPWGNAFSLVYDDYDLLVSQATDAIGNVTSTQHNYRVLQPWLATDPNLNRSGVRFDALGMVTATAAMGKLLADGTDEGDHLDTSTAEASDSDDPTTRLEYDLSTFQTWATDPNRDPDHPAPVWAHTLSRVRHQAAGTPWLEIYVYSDGLGRVALTKAQAEPGQAPQRDGSGNLVFDANHALVSALTSNRWVGTGRVVYDNKGNPVKSYEPFFDSSNVYDDESALVAWGVTSITRYDPLGRPIRVDNPDGTYTTVEFDPWSSITSDEVDTVNTSAWYAARSTGQLGADQQDAAQKAAANQATPSVSNVDTLGRTFEIVADNGADGKYATTLTLDIEGLTLVTTDALDRAVLTSAYSPGGHEVHHASVDSGERWTLLDAGGQHLLGWDSRQHQVRCEYDALRRPTQLFVATNAGAERIAEQVTYGESATDAQTLNLRGVAYQHKDEAGVSTTVQRDFDGNVKSANRQLLSDYVSDVDWTGAPALNDETFATATAYDALRRIIASTTPDGSITTPAWNERSLLAGVTVTLPGAAAATTIVESVAYDAKGQRVSIAYGNGSVSNYAYDPANFRLVQLTTTRPNGADTVQALSYTYDPVGNITRLADAAQPTIFFDNQVVTPNADYEYDAIYRLTAAKGREQIGQAGQPQTTWSDAARTLIPLPVDGAAMRNYSEDYDYDSVGNITSLDHSAVSGDWTRTYTYDPASNHLASTGVLGISNPYTEPYAYDAHGNITSMPHLSLMIWDWKDQLSATAQQIVTNGTPQTTYYRYEASGERVLKATETQNGALIAQRLYLGGYEVYREYSAAGVITLERQSLHISDGAARICLAETVTVDASNPGGGAQAPLLRYQLGNHLGSAVLELDPNTAVISYEEYYPYGSTSFQSGRTAAEVGLKRYRWSGKERDPENGFYYFRARYYAPWLARWTSADPVFISVAPALYTYASSNPVTHWDNDGRYDPSALGKAIEAGVSRVEQGLYLEDRNTATSVANTAIAVGATVARGLFSVLQIGTGAAQGVEDINRGLSGKGDGWDVAIGASRILSDAGEVASSSLAVAGAAAKIVQTGRVAMITRDLKLAQAQRAGATGSQAVKLSENIGELGAKREFISAGYESAGDLKRIPRNGGNVRQGIDQGFRDVRPFQGRDVVVEAKGLARPPSLSNQGRALAVDTTGLVEGSESWNLGRLQTAGLSRNTNARGMLRRLAGEAPESYLSVTDVRTARQTISRLQGASGRPTATVLGTLENVSPVPAMLGVAATSSLAHQAVSARPDLRNPVAR